MKALLAILILASALPQLGCTSIARSFGSTCEIKGIVRTRYGGEAVANLPVTIRGEYLGFVALVIPITSSRPLKEVTTDAQGRFSCVVPLHVAYRFHAGDMARTKWGFGSIDQDQLSKGIEAEILVQ